MRRLICALLLAAGLSSAPLTVTAQEPHMSTLATIEIPNARHPQAAVISGGQPTPAQLRAATAAGLRHVINLRPPTEDAGYDEAALAGELGLDYRVIAVSGPGDLSRETVQALDAALAEIGDEPVLLHCASGNRVGALMALRAAWLHGADADAALAIGRDYGLTKMEPVVRQKLDAGH